MYFFPVKINQCFLIFKVLTEYNQNFLSYCVYRQNDTHANAPKNITPLAEVINHILNLY